MLWKLNSNLIYLHKEEKKKAVILRLLNYATFMWCPCLKPMFETQPTCLSEETNSSKLTRNYEMQRTGDMVFNKLHQIRCSHLGWNFDVSTKQSNSISTLPSVITLAQWDGKHLVRGSIAKTSQAKPSILFLPLKLWLLWSIIREQNIKERMQVHASVNK